MDKDYILKKNYRNINHIVAKCMRIVFYFMMGILIFSLTISSGTEQQLAIICFGTCGLLLLFPTLLVNIFDIRHSLVKFIIITCTILVVGILCAFWSYKAIALVLFPLLVASLYYNRSLVLYTTLFNSLMIIASSILNVYVSMTYKMGATNVYDALVSVACPTVVIVIGMSSFAYFIVDRNSHMIEDTITYSNALLKGQEELVYAFAEISENKSKNTGEHIKRVSEYMRVLGKASGFTDEYVDKLAKASMLHDIGKIMLPEQLLDKPGKLTDEEYAMMKSHTLYGEALLMKAPGDIMEIGRTIALQHHEKWDGTGYMGLHGDQIAYVSRLMAVADVFDALTSDRYYKNGWSLEDTYNEIVGLSGIHFDPDVVQLFIDNFESFKKIYEDNPDKMLVEKGTYNV